MLCIRSVLAIAVSLPLKGIPKSALEGLERVFSTIKENGIVDIGLQAALDKGVEELDYIHVPECAVKQVNIGARSLMFKNMDSGRRIETMTPINIEGTGPGRDYTNKGTKVQRDAIRQDQLSEEDLAALIIVNLRASQAAGWVDGDYELVAACHVMAYVIGAVESGGEVKVMPNPDLTALKDDEIAFLEAFP